MMSYLLSWDYLDSFLEMESRDFWTDLVDFFFLILLVFLDSLA